MSSPIRSLRLQKRSSTSLDTLSGASGEIFFDADLGALRLYTSNNNERRILADRTWVLNNTFSGDWADIDNKPAFATVATSGNYNDLINKPTIPDVVNLDWANITNKPTFATVATSGSYSDLTNKPTIAIQALSDVTITQPLQTDQILKWSGSTWVNSAIGSLLDTNTTYSISAGSEVNGAKLILAGSDASTDSVTLVSGSNITITQTDVNTITIAAAVGSLSIDGLSDVDTSTVAPQVGQVLKWNGSNWAPAEDITSGGTGLDASTLNGFSGTYYLDYNNFSNTPSIPASLTDLGIVDGSLGQVLVTDGAGNFSFAPAPASGTTYDQSLNTTDNVTFASVTATTLTSNGTGTPTYTSGGDFIFNTGSNVGAIVVNGSIEATAVLTLTPQGSPPVGVTGSFAVADGTSWDPGNKLGTTAYPVFYNGTSWVALY